MIGCLRVMLVALLLGLVQASQAMANPSCQSGVPLILDRVERSRFGDVAVTVALPDTLNASERAGTEVLSYRLSLHWCRPAKAGTEAQYLGLPRVGGPYKIAIDGQPARPLLDYVVFGIHHVLAASPDDSPVADGSIRAASASELPLFNGRVPVLFRLPAGAQHIEIQVFAPTFVPLGLGDAYLGGDDAVFQRHQTYVRNIVGYTDVSNAATLSLTCIALILWLRRRHDQRIFWFMLAAMLWTWRGWAFTSLTVPIAPVLFEQLLALQVSGAQLALLAAIFTGIRPWTMRQNLWALGMALLMSTSFVASALIPNSLPPMIVRALWYASAYLLSLATLFRLFQTDTLDRTTKIVLLLGMTIACVVATHDAALMIGWLPPAGGPLYNWAVWGLMLSIAIAISGGVVETLNRSERQNIELEQRLAEKTAALEEQFRNRRHLERESVRLEERQRLLRDMHDGLGSHLIMALRGVERGAFDQLRVEQMLQECVDELRLVMDSSDADRDCYAALVALRHRWDPRFSVQGIHMIWQVSSDVRQVHLDANQVLQLTRIVQEATANVLKHAQATELRIEASYDGVRLKVAIIDNGVGIHVDHVRKSIVRAGQKRGRGLSNMHERARLMGASLHVLPDVPDHARGEQPRGTRVELLYVSPIA